MDVFVLEVYWHCRSIVQMPITSPRRSYVINENEVVWFEDKKLKNTFQKQNYTWLMWDMVKGMWRSWRYHPREYYSLKLVVLCCQMQQRRILDQGLPKEQEAVVGVRRFSASHNDDNVVNRILIKQVKFQMKLVHLHYLTRTSCEVCFN